MKLVIRSRLGTDDEELFERVTQLRRTEARSDDRTVEPTVELPKPRPALRRAERNLCCVVIFVGIIRTWITPLNQGLYCSRLALRGLKRTARKNMGKTQRHGQHRYIGWNIALESMVRTAKD